MRFKALIFCLAIASSFIPLQLQAITHAAPLGAYLGSGHSRFATSPHLSDTLEPRPTFTEEDARELRELERLHRLEYRRGNKNYVNIDGGESEMPGYKLAAASFVLGLAAAVCAGLVFVWQIGAVAALLTAACILTAIIFGAIGMSKLPKGVKGRRRLAVVGFIFGISVPVVFTGLVIILINFFGF